MSTTPVAIDAEVMRQRLENHFEQLHQIMLSAKGEHRAMYYGMAFGVLSSIRITELIRDDEFNERIAALEKSESASAGYDEFWQANASSTFDLSKMNPYDTLAIGVQPRSSVTAESLERFKVMEGIETPSPGARAFWASVEAKTDKPE